MRKTAKDVGVIAVVLAAGAANSLAQVSTFVVLPVPPGMSFVTPTALSGDGSTVVGTTVASQTFDIRAYRWTNAAGPQQLGVLPGAFGSRAYAVTFDGTGVYGESDGAGFEWNAPGPMTELHGTAVLDVGPDGAVRLTQTTATNGGGESTLPPLPGDQSVAATGISSDGGYASMTSHFFQSGGGYGYGGGPDVVRDQACRWTYTVGVEPCGFLPGTDRSFATNISENGAVVIGYARTGSGAAGEWFRWTGGAGGGIQPVPGVNGQSAPADGAPTDCSADGSVIVGSGNGEALVWTVEQGYRSLRQILVQNGWDVGAWTFVEIAGVSDNGRIVTGRAIDQAGELRAFVTPLDSTCAGPVAPWTATSRVIVADGDALPGGAVASQVSDITINSAGASLFRSNGDVWFSPAVSGLPSRVAAAQGDGFSGIERAALNDAGLIALSRLSFISVGQDTEAVRTVQAGPLGSLATIAAHGQAVPAPSGGGTLRTYGDFDGPFIAGSGLVAFQSRVDGGTLGTVQTFVYDAPRHAPLVRSAPSATANNPQTLAISDNGMIVRRATEGLYLGGPPPVLNTLVAPVGGAAPGFPDGTFSSFANVVVNGQGTMAFTAFVSRPNGVIQAVYRVPGGGTPQLVAAEGTFIATGVTLLDVQSLLIAENGAVYINGRTTGDTRGFVAKARPNGSISLVAQDGDNLPGAGPCRQMRNWTLEGIDGRRLLLSSQITGPSSNGRALAVWSEDEPLAILARTGDPATPRPGLTGTITSFATSSTGGSGHDGRNSPMKGGRALYTLQLQESGGTTRAVVVESTLPPLACGRADLGSAGGVTGADGRLDNNDFIAFITLFFNGDPRADMGVAGGLPGADGHLDNNDFIAFIGHFFSGCQ